MKRGYPGPQGPGVFDHQSTRPGVGTRSADPVWQFPSTGRVSPPNAPELKSTAEGVGTNAVALRKSPRSFDGIGGPGQGARPLREIETWAAPEHDRQAQALCDLRSSRNRARGSRSFRPRLCAA
jgi:hypothetical protein